MSASEGAPRRLRIGEGRISGFLSCFLGLLCVGAVACFHFPEFLTTAEFRAHYPLDLLRSVLLGCLVLAFLFALVSFLLSRDSKPAFAGVLLVALAIVLGGTGVEVGDVEGRVFSLGLDWLLIDILVLSAIFIPIELFLPQRPEQPRFHPEWRTDLVYFAISHLFVQATAVAIRFPAEQLLQGRGLDLLRQAVSAWPFLLQLFLALFVADLFQYLAHRAFHESRFLWRFHAVHHSIRSVDWIAGSRLHLVDILVTRAFSYLPLYALGFSLPVFYTYVVIVSLQAVFAHANTRLPWRPLEQLLVGPRYHHWHHAAKREAHDKNYAIHFPWIDRLFGTQHFPPEEWPERMGLDDEPMPSGYLRQLVQPLLPERLRRQASARGPSSR